MVLNIVFAWERAVAWTTEDESEMIASHRFPMYRPDPSLMDLRFLTLYFQSHLGNLALRSVSPGGAGRNKTLNQQAFLKLTVPVPPLEEQRTIGLAHQVLTERLAAEDRGAQQLRKIKTELMNLLLTGEVRVTPDSEAA